MKIDKKVEEEIEILHSRLDPALEKMRDDCLKLDEEFKDIFTVPRVSYLIQLLYNIEKGGYVFSENEQKLVDVILKHKDNPNLSEEVFEKFAMAGKAYFEAVGVLYTQLSNHIPNETHGGKTQ